MRAALALYLAVALGTALGGTGRALVSLALAGPGWPWATLAVNGAGSFLIGFYATLTGPGGRMFASARTRHFVMTGICGGFTTFSLFSLETLRLAAERGHAAAALNVGSSVAVWLAAVWAGQALAERMNRW